MSRFMALAAVVLLAGCEQAPQTPPTQVPDGETALVGGTPSGPTLEGSVIDEAGQPVPDVKIILYGGLATRWKVAETTTDADGIYRFAPLTVGARIKDEDADRWDYSVGMRIEHATLASADGHSWWDQRVPNIPGAVTRHDFTMTLGGTLEGQLVDTNSGEPLAQITLCVAQPNRDSPRFTRYATTDDQGRFRETALYPGSYIVDVNDPRARFPVLGEVTIRPGEVTRVDWRMARPARDGK